MENLKGKTAFITGGASGIGLGIAKAFAKEGVNVALVDLRQNAIDEALTFFKDGGYPAIGVRLNVVDRDAYIKAADEVEEKFGKIHFLINNAGIGCANGPLWDAQYKDVDFALDINLKGILNGIKVVIPRIIAHGEGGYVVSTASKAGLIPVPGCGLYNLTKQAVIGITETLACDLPENIGAAVLCPGPFDSNLGFSSMQVQSELLNEPLPTFGPPPGASDDAPPPPPANPSMNTLFHPPEEAGARVIRGIKRGDIYIITHSEFKDGWVARADAITRAFPNDPEDANFKKTFAFLTYNPVFDKQTDVPAL
jgi:NAD(P)-dependent dehydrogenase (short-subunit alcohol dehydrogenase family)